jgi:4-aminobutyrate aminotransferase-like enzyme
MLAALRQAQLRHPLIGDVRGIGLLIGVEMVLDRATKQRPPPALPRRLLVSLAKRGVLTAGAGPVLRIPPPLVIPDRLALRGVSLLEEALSEVEEEWGLAPPR